MCVRAVIISEEERWWRWRRVCYDSDSIGAKRRHVGRWKCTKSHLQIRIRTPTENPYTTVISKFVHYTQGVYRIVIVVRALSVLTWPNKYYQYCNFIIFFVYFHRPRVPFLRYRLSIMFAISYCPVILIFYIYSETIR